MHRLTCLLIIIFALGCNTEEDINPYTGETQSYELVRASEFPIYGTATFIERRDEMVEIRIQLDSLETDQLHPAHLHYGDVSMNEADVAKILNPVDGETGLSVTIFDALDDEVLITYQELINIEGHIKVHLDGGVNKSIILAQGNVGGLATD